MISEVLHGGVTLQMFVGDFVQFRPQSLNIVCYESRLKAKLALKDCMTENFALMPGIQKVLDSNLVCGVLHLSIQVSMSLHLNTSYLLG